MNYREVYNSESYEQAVALRDESLRRLITFETRHFFEVERSTELRLKLLRDQTSDLNQELYAIQYYATHGSP